MSTNLKTGIKCTDCNEVLPNEWINNTVREKCPKCGSISHTIEMNITEELKLDLHDNFDGKVKDKNFNSKRNPRLHIQEGSDVRKDDGKFMQKTRIIDKYNDKYIEKVTDPETGEVVHECEESLSDHFGHGSDKPKTDKNA